MISGNSQGEDYLLQFNFDSASAEDVIANIGTYFAEVRTFSVAAGSPTNVFIMLRFPSSTARADYKTAIGL